MLYAFDFSFVRQVSAVKGIIDIKGQYNLTNVDQATYFEPEPDPNNPPDGIISRSEEHTSELQSH